MECDCDGEAKPGAEIIPNRGRGVGHVGGGGRGGRGVVCEGEAWFGDGMESRGER